MIAYILLSAYAGFIVGTLVGFWLASILTAAHDADEQAARMMEDQRIARVVAEVQAQIDWIEGAG